MKWYTGGILRRSMVLEEGQGCSEVLTFHTAPTGHLLAKHPSITCWPRFYRTEGFNLSQYEPCLQKKVQSFHLPRDTLKLAGGQNHCQGSPSSPVVTRGPTCTQSPSPASGAPTPRAQPSSEGNELQTPSCAGRWKA